MGSPAERADRELLRNLEAEAVTAHNACHDWLIANPSENQAPDDLAHELYLAEEAVRFHKQRMAKLRFDASK
jgi:hypothetical protein